MKPHYLWCVVLVLVVLAIGCGNTRTKGIDASDPQYVAEAAWRAIIADDYDELQRYVLLERYAGYLSKDRLGSELKKDCPQPFPNNPIIRTIVWGNLGTCGIKNWEGTCQLRMKFRDGRWWVSR